MEQDQEIMGRQYCRLVMGFRSRLSRKMPLWHTDYFELMLLGPITSWEIDEETVETVSDLFWGAPKSLQMVTETMKLKDACSLEEKL